jgi:hypothetical protein
MHLRLLSESGTYSERMGITSACHLYRDKSDRLTRLFNAL